MESKGRRSSIRKATIKDEDNTEVRLGRRISFSGKKFVRIFCGEEEPKNWDNSYEVSDHTNGDETASSKPASEKSYQTTQIFDASHKENVEYSCAAMDIVDRSQDSQWQVETSVNFTLLPQEVNRKKQLQDSLTNKVSNSSENLSFLSQSEREKLKLNKNCPELLEETFSMELKHTQTLNTNRKPEGNRNFCDFKSSMKPSAPDNGLETFEEKLKQISICADSDDNMEESLTCFGQSSAPNKRNPRSTIILHENINCKDGNDTIGVRTKNKTINFNNENIDCCQHVTSVFEDKAEPASSLKELKGCDKTVLNFSALSSASSLDLETPLSSPLIPANCLSGSCTKKKLNFRQLNDEIEQGRLRIFADGPKTPTLDKLGKNKHWLFEKNYEKSPEQKQSKVRSPLRSVNDMDISEIITSNINAPKIVANTKAKTTFRYSQADEMLLDNTNFLTHVKLGDESLSQNNSKSSNARKTIYFSTNMSLDESVKNAVQPSSIRNDTMDYLNRSKNAKEACSLDISPVEVATQGPSTNQDSEAHPKSRKTLHFDNIDMEISPPEVIEVIQPPPEVIEVIQPPPTGDEDHTLSLDSFNADVRNCQSVTKLKRQESIHTPKMNRTTQMRMAQSLQCTPGRSLLEFEEMEQQCQEELFTPRNSKFLQMSSSKLPRKSIYEQIDMELETSPALQNVTKANRPTPNSTRMESKLNSAQNSSCKRIVEDHMETTDMILENSHQNANRMSKNLETTAQDQVSTSSKAIVSFNHETIRNLTHYNAKASDRSALAAMVLKNDQQNSCTEREEVKGPRLIFESYSKEVSQNDPPYVPTVEDQPTALENINPTTETHSIKETIIQQGNREIGLNSQPLDMEVDEEEATQQALITQKRRQTICLPIDIIPEDDTSSNAVAYRDANVNCSIREYLSLRDNSELSQSINNNVPTCINNSAELDFSVCKTAITNSLSVKRASQFLTPNYRNSKKRQTIIFEDCRIESTTPLPANAAQRSMECLPADKICEHLNDDAHFSTLERKALGAKTTKVALFDASCREHSGMLQPTQQVDNKSLFLMSNNSVYCNSFKLDNDLNTPLKHTIQLPRKNLVQENKSIFELKSPELRKMRKSESLCMTLDEIACEEQTLRSLTLINESNFKRLADINNEFINLSNDTMFLNGVQETTTNELLDETRISLVETLIHDDDDGDDDYSIEPIAVEIPQHRVETKTAKGIETSNRKCQHCALSLEDGENTSDSFELPQLQQLSWVQRAMDRLRRLRAKPRLSDVHEYYRRKHMEETVNPDKCKSNVYALVEELCQKPQRSKRLIQTGVLPQRTPHHTSKPLATFVNRLKALITQYCPNWIFDYQLEARNQYIFPHRKLHIMQLIVDYEYTDALGIDLRVKSVKFDFDRTPKKNWDALDYLVQFELQLNMSYMLQPYSFSTIDNEKAFLHLLRHIDKACVKLAVICNDLWNIVCMKQAQLVREADRTIIRKAVRKVVSSKGLTFSRVEEQEFIVEITNIKKTSVKDILKPHVSSFEKSIESLPNGLNFLSNFLEDPTKFLNP